MMQIALGRGTRDKGNRQQMLPGGLLLLLPMPLPMMTTRTRRRMLQSNLGTGWVQGFNGDCRRDGHCKRRKGRLRQ